jgi:hypothetical protein
LWITCCSGSEEGETPSEDALEVEVRGVKKIGDALVSVTGCIEVDAELG